MLTLTRVLCSTHRGLILKLVPCGPKFCRIQFCFVSLFFVLARIPTVRRLDVFSSHAPCCLSGADPSTAMQVGGGHCLICQERRCRTECWCGRRGTAQGGERRTSKRRFLTRGTVADTRRGSPARLGSWGVQVKQGKFQQLFAQTDQPVRHSNLQPSFSGMQRSRVFVVKLYV